MAPLFSEGFFRLLRAVVSQGLTINHFWRCIHAYERTVVFASSEIGVDGVPDAGGGGRCRVLLSATMNPRDCRCQN